jgi:hypothetical protein
MMGSPTRFGRETVSATRGHWRRGCGGRWLTWPGRRPGGRWSRSPITPACRWFLSHYLHEAGIAHDHRENPGNHGGRADERYQVALQWLSDVLDGDVT